jgi:glycosyltransferase involved in cell wall biosynthesis
LEEHSSVKHPPLLSVIMPAFNEGKRIRKNLDETVDTFKSMGIPFEIIVVNDGSTDDTSVEIEKSANDHPEVTLVTYMMNGGKGNALKEGFKHASGDLITFVDADLEIHPKQLRLFLDVLDSEKTDVVIGSKRHPDSIISYPVKRRILSRCYNLLIQSMFQVSISDTQPGLKLFKRQVLEDEFPKVFVKRYAFDLELLLNAIRDNYTISEAPIEVKFVRENGGRIKMNDVKDIFMDTVGIFYRVKFVHSRISEPLIKYNIAESRSSVETKIGK